MSMNATDHTDDETGIQPVRVRKKGETGKGRLPSKSTIEDYIKAAMDLYIEQVNDPTNLAMNESVPRPRTAQLAVIMDEFSYGWESKTVWIKTHNPHLTKETILRQ